ncbi:MAG: hypothetical protein AB1483_00600 [Candidatus Zixiibacteriota bacterium]
MRLFLTTVASIAILGMVVAGCSSNNPVQSPANQVTVEKKTVVPSTGEGSFNVEAKYTYVRSYPGGGGIFVLRLVPGADLTGDVALSVSADKMLGASVSTPVVNSVDPVFEVTISPTNQVTLATHIVTVTANNQSMSQTVELQVEVVNWGILSMNIAQETQDRFIDWLNVAHPELGTFSNQDWEIYGTYPQIMIVEHYTFLSSDWEFRVCFHVMIPPYDWSKMLLRGRGEWDATIAAIREWDEVSQTYVIHEIPVEEYPVIYGY